MKQTSTPRTIRLRLEQLELDVLNPRLVVEKGITQEQLVQVLYEEEGLDELVSSLLDNGYFEEEPLVVVPNGHRFTVIEGNRRLATLKLLSDPSLRRAARVSGWPTPAASQLERLTEIPCVVYDHRDEVLPFLGFRHITGARKWAPFQKARFVSQMLETRQSLETIEAELGDDTQTIKKLYQDFVIFEQATAELGIPHRLLRDRFSLLEVMLGQRPIKKHLGIPHRLPTEHVSSLVPEDRLDAFEETIVWIFGDADSAPIATDSRDISKRLAKVVEDPAALEVLRATNDLDEAFERIGGEEKHLQRRISVAERALRDIHSLYPLYAGNSSIEQAIDRLAKMLESLASLRSSDTSSR